MTGDAAFGLKRRMFIYEWAGRFCVTLRADGILVRARLEQLVLKCAMRIVAIAALHQSFIDLVMEGLSKCGLGFGVAAVTQLGIVKLEQVLFPLGSVNAMAADATDVGCPVRRALEIRMSTGMTTQAGVVDHFGGGL